MRHSAARSLLERDDVIIVASVSCIYGIGSVETYTAMTSLKLGDQVDQRQLVKDLVALQYKREQGAISRAACSACAATRLKCFRPTTRTAPGGSASSVTRSRHLRIRSADRVKTQDLEFVKVYAKPITSRRARRYAID